MNSVLRCLLPKKNLIVFWAIHTARETVQGYLHNTNWLGGPENVMPGVLTFRMIVARSVHCDHGLSIFSSAGWLSVVNKHCYVSFFIFSSFFLSCTLCSSMPGCAIFFSMACTVMHSLHTNFNVVQQDSMQGHMGHLIITNIAVRNFSDGRISTDVI